MPTIDRACRIDGYMDCIELRWLADEAARHRCIVEVGSYLGRSTRALADSCPGVIYAIDNWRGPVADGKIIDSSVDQYERFCSNLQDHIASGRVIPIRCEHRSATVPETPDMVFIDGDHEQIRADVEQWQKRMKRGGLLCGHDFHWPGLCETLWDMFGSVDVAPGTSIWWRKLD